MTPWGHDYKSTASENILAISIHPDGFWFFRASSRNNPGEEFCGWTPTGGGLISNQLNMIKFDVIKNCC
jgi:hypothetical protein